MKTEDLDCCYWFSLAESLAKTGLGILIQKTGPFYRTVFGQVRTGLRSVTGKRFISILTISWEKNKYGHSNNSKSIYKLSQYLMGTGYMYIKVMEE